MKQHSIPGFLLVGLLLSGIGHAADRPNIVLMLSDDQSWYGLSVQMHPDMPNSKSDFYHTPRLEEFASQGMRFSNAYAPATVCSPTRASLQTGMSPAKNHWTKAAPIAAITEDLDTGVGVLLDGLEDLGLNENTYVIYMGDNGHRPNDNNMPNNRADNPAPLVGDKGNVSEGGIRVPFIIRGPGIAANSWSHVPMVGHDLFPTYAEWAGIDTDDLPEGIEGGSIASIVANGDEGEVNRPREELVFHFPHYQVGSPQSAIRVGDFKLIKYYEGNLTALFELSTDIGEKHNLVREMPEKAAELEARLDTYLASVNADIPVINPHYDASKPTGFTGNRRNPDAFFPHNESIDVKLLYYPE